MKLNRRAFHRHALVSFAVLLVVTGVSQAGASEMAQSGPVFVVKLADDADQGQCGVDTCTLREAINAVNNSTDAATITFDAGAFSTAQSISLATALPMIAKPTTIAGPSANILTVQGGAAAGFDVFRVNNGVTAALSGMTISNGYIGIDNDGTLSIANCIISGNIHSGIYSDSEDGTVAATNCIFSGNETGIYNNTTGATTVTDCTLSGNDTGIYNFGGAATVTNCTFSGNTTNSIDNTGTATATQCTFSGNNAGIYNFGGTATATKCTFGGNTSSAIYNDSGVAVVAGCTLGTGYFGIINSGTVTVTNCTLNGNNSGLINTGTATAPNCTFTRNGTGINNDAGGTVETTNCTISGNTSFGVKNNFGTMTLMNTLCAANSTNVSGAVIDGGHNILSGTAAQAGLEVDDQGAPVLKDNGGLTFTIALVTPSGTAINAGDNTLVASGITTDGRGTGFPRTLGGKVDIGAFEFGSVQSGPGFVVNKTSDIDDGTCDSLDCTLREAINAANANSGAATITFSPLFNTAQSISLSSALPALNNAITITGPGANLLNVQGSGTTGFDLFHVNSGMTVTLSGLTVSNGNAGINNEGTLLVNRCTLSGSGSGLRNSGTVTTTACTLSGNGSGLANSGTATVANCTFGGNGIGINNDGNGTVTAANCTLSGSTGIGLNNTLGTITLMNTLCAGNITDISGVITDGGHNILSGTAAQAGLEVDGNGAAVLKDNGGPTFTFALVAGSAAINVGDNALLPPDALDLNGNGNITEALPFDQRGNGFARVRSGTVDIGAFEFQNDVPAVTPLATTTWANRSIINRPLPATDADGDILTYSLGTAPANGTVGGVIGTDGLFLYTPSSGYTGLDSFIINVSDGKANTPITVSVQVDAAPAPGTLIYTSVGGADCNAVGASDFAHGYTSLLLDKMNAMYGAGTWALSNRGVNSFSTADLRRTVGGQSVLSLTAADAPRAVTLWIGPNDAVQFVQAHLNSTTFPVDDFLLQFTTDYTAALTELKGALAGTPAGIVAANIPKIGDLPVATALGLNATQKESFNSLCGLLSTAISTAATNATVPVVDLSAAASEPTDIAVDGFHPSDGGYDKLRQSFWTLLRPQINRKPVADTQTLSTPAGQPVSGKLTATDPDLDEGTITFAVAQPAQGSFTLDSNTGVFTYTPNGTALGANSVLFTAHDTDSADGIINITVTEAPSLVVNTANDASTNIDGLTSLREAINAANANLGNASPGTATITFSPLFNTAQSISLSSALPPLSNTVTISGPGANLLTVQGGGTGGGIVGFDLFHMNSGVSVTLSGLTISNGNAGINNEGTLLVNRCTLSGSGSGLRNSGTVTTTACTLSGNGNGLANSGTATAANCTFGGNGIGINNDGNGTVTAANCTLSGSTGIGLNNTLGTITLMNTLCAGNITDTSGVITDGGHNILSGTAAQAGLEVDGNGAAVLKDNGGPTFTFALVTTNGTAVNTGGDALIPGGITTDQRGQLRIQGGQVDIGAFEAPDLPQSGPGFVVNKTGDTDDGTCGIADCTLREAINAANANPGAATITFSPLFNTAQSISLSSALPPLSNTVTITGPGANLLTVQGGGTGGGIVGFDLFHVNSGVSVTLSGLTVSNGNAGINNEGTLLVNRCTLSGSGSGLRNSGTVTTTACTLSGNGNGLANSGTATAANSTFSSNSSAINNSSGVLITTGCTLDSNTSGITNARNGTVTATGCTLSGNSSHGIANDGVATAINCTLYGNGTGIVSNQGTLTATNSTVSGNGSGISNSSGLVTFRNTLCAGNTTANVNGTIIDGGHNIITGSAADAGLDPAGLADNGGSTKTIALLVSSQAIDAGDNALIPGGVTTDQRGRARIQGSRVDIGAFESLPLLRIDSTKVTEGPTPGISGTTVDATFTVTLAGASAQLVTVNYATATGVTNPATSGVDYTPTSGTLTFAPGETAKTIKVPVIGDTLDEPNETFVVNLSNVTGAILATTQGQCFILDDDAPPTMAINDVSVLEGNSGTLNANFTVSLSAASSRPITVNYQTTTPVGTPATAGVDYVAVPLATLTFAPGETSKTVTILINGDTLDEIDERFSVKLSSITNAVFADSEGFCTIIDDDAPPSLKINDVTVTEGNPPPTGAPGTTPANFMVSLSAPSGKSVAVQYNTATPSGMPATADVDYVAVPTTTLTFAPGETSKPVTVLVKRDTLDEATERFAVNLKNAGNATIADKEGFCTINDDDAPPSLSINDVTLAEGNSGVTAFNFTVTLSAASGKTVTVKYQTILPSSLIATPGIDYTAVPLTTLTFAPGETAKQITVFVNGDTIVEGTERFSVKMSTSANATISDGEGFGTILNDDSGNVPALHLEQNPEQNPPSGEDEPSE